MKVTTESDRIQKHRTILYSMYMADHELDADGLPVETGNTNQLRELCKTIEPLNLEPVEAAWDRIIRTTVGLRPHRPSGFVVRAEKFDEIGGFSGPRQAA